ncbi:GOLPH3/VPS74 family protein [Amycolatopsis thermalba]|uniref:GOLPH3/VPS74 family protein n=1 Tax=Amycolatopsis thermalba TaxID=944492 RepID=UPI000E227805|nr:GPP34 family phosphoprotein [Amycolatopsis thermalba]
MDTPDSLAARLFLLAYDTTKQRLVSRSELGYALRAAALADLVLGGYLADHGGKAAPASPAPGLDPVLELVLLEITDSPPRSWRRWVSRRASRILPLVREHLAAERVIKVDSRRVLGLFPVHRITLRRPAEAKRLAEEVRRAVRGGRPAGRVDPRLGALCALAGTAELRTVFSRGERRQYKARLAELGRPVEPVVKALRKTLQAQRAAASSGS